MGQDLVDIKAQLAKESSEDILKRITVNRGKKIGVTQDKKFILPDGTETEEPISGVVVEFIAANNFYTAKYRKGAANPPACFARGVGNELTLVPSPNSPDRQAETCAKCKQNEFPGGKGIPKPCKNERLLAFVEIGKGIDPEKTQILTLKVSPTAIRAWDDYVKEVKKMTDMYPISVVTEVSFADDRDFGSLRFKMIGENPFLAAHAGRREEAMELLMTEPDLTEAQTAAAPAKGKKGK